MYICLCRGITEKQLQDATRGQPRVEDVLRRCKVGRDCGACLDQAMATCRQYRLEQKSPVSPIKQK